MDAEIAHRRKVEAYTLDVSPNACHLWAYACHFEDVGTRCDSEYA